MPKKVFGIICSLTIITSVIFMAGIAHAVEDSSKSNSYQFSESTVGSDGNLDANSNSYNATSSTGDLVVGDSSSGSYNVSAGSKTTNDPTLSFIVTGGSTDFGSFSTTQTTTTTSTFSVINYTSWGYVVQIVGNAPKNGAHSIPALSENSESIAGTEQFGINLVANTDPSNFGANPNNGQFGFGEAATNYNTTNQFRYVSGEIIANAPKSSGKTDYTISYIVNVDSMTPGGVYTCDQTLVVTGTY